MYPPFNCVSVMFAAAGYVAVMVLYNLVSLTLVLPSAPRCFRSLRGGNRADAGGPSSFGCLGGKLTVIQAMQVGLVYRAARRSLFIQGGGNPEAWVDPNPWGGLGFHCGRVPEDSRTILI